MKQEFVTLPREAVELALAALDAEDPYRAAIVLRAALEQPDHSEQSYMGCVTSDMHELAEWLNTMYEDSKEQIAALEQPQVEQEICCKIWSVNRIDDLGKIVDSSGRLIATVYGSQADKIVACHNSYTHPQPKREPLTDEQIDAIAESMPGGLDGFLKGWGWRQFARAVLEAAPQPPTTEQSSAVVEECLTDELKPRFSAHDDAERLKSVARGMSYNDHGEAVWKHTLMEIAVRLESGGYAAPQPPALEQQVEKESTCKDSLQVEQEPVAVVDFTTGGWTKIVDAMRTLPDGAQLYTHPQARREPLTHYEIHELFRRSWDYCQDGDEIKAFARAIEAAHNIK